VQFGLYLVCSEVFGSTLDGSCRYPLFRSSAPLISSNLLAEHTSQASDKHTVLPRQAGLPLNITSHN